MVIEIFTGADYRHCIQRKHTEHGRTVKQQDDDLGNPPLANYPIKSSPEVYDDGPRTNNDRFRHNEMLRSQ